MLMHKSQSLPLSKNLFEGLFGVGASFALVLIFALCVLWQVQFCYALSQVSNPSTCLYSLALVHNSN